MSEVTRTASFPAEPVAGAAAEVTTEAAVVATGPAETVACACRP
ncbi:hypothetical protein [Streptomyces sp. NPDC051079]